MMTINQTSEMYFYVLLNDFLKWHNERNGLFQLYRLVPGSNFEVDFSIFDDGENISTTKKLSEVKDIIN
jgi:hypothetical protein